MIITITKILFLFFNSNIILINKKYSKSCFLSQFLVQFSNFCKIQFNFDWNFNKIYYELKKKCISNSWREKFERDRVEDDQMYKKK